jgi:hypothetical protein
MYSGEEFKEVLKEHLKPIHYTDPKIAEFISNYLKTRSVNAAEKASDLHKGDGKYLFNQPDIYKCIEMMTERDVVKFGYEAAEVVERTKELAFFDPIDLVNPDGTFKENLHDVPAHARQAIKSIEAKNYFENDENGIPQYKGKIIKYQFHDKIKPQEMLGREKDLYKKKDVVEHDISKNARQFLLGSGHRAAEAKAQLEGPRDVTGPVISVKAVPVFERPPTAKAKPMFKKPGGV